MILSYLRVLSLVFLLSLFVTTKEAFAATIFYDVPPPQGAPILSAEQCQAPPECANTAVPGQSNQCGQACPDSGSGAGRSWTKYRLTCVLDPETDRPTGHYQEDDIVCSIADKCQYQPFLQSGRCDCSVGGTYKTCCTGDGNVNGSCVASGTQDNSFPDEGSCPGGSTTVMCGVSQSTCNAVYPMKCTTSSCGGDACSHNL